MSLTQDKKLKRKTIRYTMALPLFLSFSIFFLTGSTDAGEISLSIPAGLKDSILEAQEGRLF